MKDKQMTIRMTPQTRSNIDDDAKKKERSASFIANQILEKHYLKIRPKKNNKAVVVKSGVDYKEWAKRIWDIYPKDRRDTSLKAFPDVLKKLGLDNESLNMVVANIEKRNVYDEAFREKNNWVPNMVKTFLKEERWRIDVKKESHDSGMGAGWNNKSKTGVLEHGKY